MFSTVVAPKAASVWPHKHCAQNDWVSADCVEATFGKAKRLLNATDYARVFDGPDARASHKQLLLLARRNDAPVHRLGLVIAKKNIRLAVQRNRIKRLAREFFRTLPSSDPCLDVVLLARQGLGHLDNAQVSSILQQQWQKLVSHAVTTTANTRQET